MDIEKLIVDRLNKKPTIKASDIVKSTGFSRAYINRFFQKLKDKGKIVLLGKANKARYVLTDKEVSSRAKKDITSVHRILQNKDLSEDRVLDEIKKNTGILIGISNNVLNAAYYAFTEMLNNAIEHSRSKVIEITMEKGKKDIKFRVIDRGVGIFNNIRHKKHLHNDMEAIQDLIKGKLSTAPETHTGEGIFFTSKIGKMLTLQSSRKKLIFDNLLNDIFIKDVKNSKGTKVTFSINLSSTKKLTDVFQQYTDDSLEFSKTKVKVRLYKKGAEYISRSQARRIVSGLDNFKTITLDFKKVKTIGQGFADEIFRVWKSRYPKITIIPKNTNENIQFMINRASSQKRLA